uniref:PAP-associated domain-containing protein n=1 Tax=Ditylenchus dipsaci TaxID=166011 RepID=A0A915CSS0_9BILA
MECKLRVKLDQPMLSLISFGSLVNGFAQNDCDLDLCLRLDETNTRLKEEVESTLSKIAEVFEEEGYKVEKVFNAKVKIVKFSDSQKNGNGFMGDVSFSNSLAIYNSVMLQTYSKFDDRVPKLGLFIKAWAKLFDVNDASTGSLSSYAYIVLMINYLQNCEEPVLPFLQEAAKDASSERIDVDGWNAQFVSDTETLKELKKHCNNKRSVGELFYGFLKYYANRFDFEFNVVQIRSQQRVTKLDKSWNGYYMCVEDPFDLSHNLTGGVKIRNFMHFMVCLKSSINGLRLLADESKDLTKPFYFSLDSFRPFIPAKFGPRGKGNDRQKA